jgi:pimeloyl-ACP methyl ester carboxylesterase
MSQHAAAAASDDQPDAAPAGGPDPATDPDPDPPPTATATVDGRPVRYAASGATSGTPVLLWHGTPGSRLLGALYDDAAREQGVRLLVPDRPGFGRSPAWDGRTLADAGRIAAAVLDDAGVERAGAVGFSGGGAQALAAATTTDRVTAVDLVSTAVPPSLRETPPFAQRLLEGAATHTPRLLGAVLRWQAWMADRRPSLALAQLTDDPDALADDEATLAARDFLAGIGPSRRGLVAETRLLGSPWDLPPADPSVPVRLWHGADDGNVPVAGARRFAEGLDAETTVLDGADHLTALLETRERVLARHGDGD